MIKILQSAVPLIQGEHNCLRALPQSLRFPDFLIDGFSISVHVDEGTDNGLFRALQILADFNEVFSEGNSVLIYMMQLLRW